MTNDISPSPSRRGTGKEVFVWSLYDWANSAWSTISITVLLAYITTVVAPGNLGTIIWGWGLGVSMFIAAIISPVLGALADSRGSKRTWLAITALGGAAAATLMGFVPETNTWLVVALFFVGSLGYELAWGIYNGFLPEIADDTTMNRVSAWGFGMGYVGGGLALLIAILVLMFGDRIGLPNADAMTMDFNSTREGTFAVDLPDGIYNVRVTLGDASSARKQMQVTLPGRDADLVDSPRAATAVVEHTVSVTGGKLRVQFKSLGADDVSINGLEISGKDPALRLGFDFGTEASKGEPGYVWVVADDQFAVRDLTAEKRVPAIAPDAKTPPLDIAALADRYAPERGDLHAADSDQLLGFGWESGEIEGRDAVGPPRMRVGLAIMGVWWAVFSLPAIFVLRDRPRPPAPPQTVVQMATDSIHQVATTLRNVRKFPMLFLFLLGFLFYNDGMQTVITQAGVFAQSELGMTASDLGMLVLMIQFVALPGALFVGKLSDWIGTKKTLNITLTVWVGLIVAAFFVTTAGQFWVMGVVLALVMGGAQSVSRAIMGFMTPERYSAEFMGFFNLSGKAVSVLGPILFSTIMALSGSAHLAILSLLIFFIVGWAFVMPVSVERGRQQALTAEAQVEAAEAIAPRD